MEKLRDKQQRLVVVLDICEKLRNFPKADNPNETVDLYNYPCSAITELKSVFSSYVNQNDDIPKLLTSFSGKIKFEEIQKTIEYTLPIKKHNQPIFVIRSN